MLFISEIDAILKNQMGALMRVVHFSYKYVKF